MSQNGPDCFNDNNNPTVVIENGVDVTLTADEQLVAAGTVQVYPNSEFAQAFPASKAAVQTVLSIPSITPGANP